MAGRNKSCFATCISEKTSLLPVQTGHSNLTTFCCKYRLLVTRIGKFQMKVILFQDSSDLSRNMIVTSPITTWLNRKLTRTPCLFQPTLYPLVIFELRILQYLTFNNMYARCYICSQPLQKTIWVEIHICTWSLIFGTNFGWTNKNLL